MPVLSAAIVAITVTVAFFGVVARVELSEHVYKLEAAPEEYA